MNLTSALRSTASFMRACKRPNWLFAAVGMFALPVSEAGAAIFDDFNDGNDLGWTRVSPLEQLGAVGTFTFPSGAYGIQSPISPQPNPYGPGRAGSFRQDESFTNFDVSVDLVSLTLSPSTSLLGLLARVDVSSIGLGTTDGYALLYDIAGAELSLLRITNEASVELDTETALVLDPSKNYRLRMIGVGATFTATIAEAATPTVPIRTLTANDATYASGVAGLLVYDGSTAANQVARGTFDNFSATVPEPTAVALLAFGGAFVAARRRRTTPGH